MGARGAGTSVCGELTKAGVMPHSGLSSLHLGGGSRKSQPGLHERLTQRIKPTVGGGGEAVITLTALDSVGIQQDKGQ